jgi:hypothetical protein
MKKLLAAAVFLSFGLGTTFAATSLDIEVVTGTGIGQAGGNGQVVLWNGTTVTYAAWNGTSWNLVCSSGGGSGVCGGNVTATTFGSGQLSLQVVSVGGWSVSTDTGSSNSPNCSGVYGPDCANTSEVNAQSFLGDTTALAVYFGTTGFASESGLICAESASGITGSNSPSASASCYAGSGTPFTFSDETIPTGFTSGNQIGSTLTLTALGSTTSGGSAPLTAPFSLGIEDTFKGGSTSDAYNVDTTISAVPEPASVTMLGGVLLLAAGAIRRKTRKAA